MIQILFYLLAILAGSVQPPGHIVPIYIASHRGAVPPVECGGCGRLPHAL